MAEINPTEIKLSAYRGYLPFHFRENNVGASPSCASVIIIDVSAYRDAVIV
jgi:hypothetical protein